MQDWEYDEMREVDDESITWNTAYLWIVPAKVEGSWKFMDGDLELNQNYQIVFGNMNKNGSSFTISEGKLRGDILNFTCNGVNYECTVYGNEMKGTAEKDGNTSNWSATKSQ